MSELGDGWFRILTWRDARGHTGVWAWLATYTDHARAVREFGVEAQTALEQLFEV